MFIVEGRTLGVFAALGVVFSMVVLDRLSDVADSTDPRSLPAFTTVIAAPSPAMRHDGELAPPRDRCLETPPHVVASIEPVEAARVSPKDATCRARAGAAPRS